MKYLITILSGLILAGCVSIPNKSQPNYSKISIPELNQPTSTYLGEKLLTQAEGMFTKSITLGEADGANSKIYGGKFCNYNPNEKLYVSNDPKAVGNKTFMGEIAGYSSFVTYHEEENKVCANAISCYDSSEIAIDFKENDLCIAPNSFERVIEYNGKSGDVLNFTYNDPFTIAYWFKVGSGEGMMISNKAGCGQGSGSSLCHRGYELYVGSTLNFYFINTNSDMFLWDNII